MTVTLPQNYIILEIKKFTFILHIEPSAFQRQHSTKSSWTNINMYNI